MKIYLVITNPIISSWLSEKFYLLASTVLVIILTLH